MFRQSHWMSVLKSGDEAQARRIAAALETLGIMTRIMHNTEAGEWPGDEIDEVTLLVEERDYERAVKAIRQGIATTGSS
jgi:hypothetical protein